MMLLLFAGLVLFFLDLPSFRNHLTLCRDNIGSFFTPAIVLKADRGQNPTSNDIPYDWFTAPHMYCNNDVTVVACDVPSPSSHVNAEDYVE